MNVKVLNKLSDVQQLEQAEIPKEFVRYLLQEWKQMYEAFSEGESINEFQINSIAKWYSWNLLKMTLP
jgi:hypothetical protein